MINGVTFAVNEYLGEISDLGDTVVGGLLTGDPDPVSNLKGGRVIALEIESLLAIGHDSTPCGEGHDDG